MGGVSGWRSWDGGAWEEELGWRREDLGRCDGWIKGEMKVWAAGAVDLELVFNMFLCL